MPKEFQTQNVGKIQIQSGIPMRPRRFESSQPMGLTVRGIVTTTYVLDDPDHPQVSNDPVAVYCDVLIYASISGMQQRLIKSALVLQERLGMHTGRIWKPKAASLDSIKNIMNFEKGTNLASVNGDHVLVGFMDNSFNFPVILGSIPHPSSDIGNEQNASGHRLRMTQVDGDPDFWKHHGTYFGVEDNGDYTVDSTFANNGVLAEDGKEAAPPTDGKGSQRFKLAQDSEHEIALYDMSTPTSPVEVLRITATKDTWEIHFAQGNSLKVELKDADTKLTLGDGAVAAVIYQALETFWNNTFKGWETGHTHPTGVGPSGPPVESATFPSMDTAAKSTHLLIPDA